MDTKLNLRIRDATGQRERRAKVSPDVTAMQVIDAVLPQLQLPKHSNSGVPYIYHVRDTKSGEALHGSDRIGDLSTEDAELELELQQTIIPGVR